MPIELQLDNEVESITLADFVLRLDSLGLNLTMQSDLIRAAPLLKKLANNRTFLLDAIFDEIEKDRHFQQANVYGPQVFIIHATDRYALRAVIWKPLSPLQKALPGFQYDICHDHNFDILTVGYFGPGYQCRSYSYELSECSSRLGEYVNLTDQGLFTLTQGKVALYRSKRDVHIQLPPPALSVSLNLIPRGPSLAEIQFQFEEETGRICRYLQISGSELAVRFAGLIKDPRFTSSLARIAEAGANAQIRALAIVSQTQIGAYCNGAKDTLDLEERLQVYPTFIQHLVRTELARYGTTLRMAPPFHPEERNVSAG